jgi:Fe-S oxidoreductase
MLDYAKKCGNENIRIFKGLISEDTPLIGLEPSAILTFRDEYPKLVDDKEGARKIAPYALLAEEFLALEIKAGNVRAEQFTDTPKEIKVHGHCHQKAIASVTPTQEVLSLPQNFSVEVIPSGCCGMSGSFGYDADHYDVSMQIGELVLFPAVRKAKGAIIAAPGTSCRHQIYDGTGVKAKHPVQILVENLNKG